MAEIPSSGMSPSDFGKFFILYLQRPDPAPCRNIIEHWINCQRRTDASGMCFMKDSIMFYIQYNIKSY